MGLSAAPPPDGHVLKYRPDIDGLRAVAVLAVIVFHLGMPVRGGFVGVDVFFTISGFLIGSIIIRQVQAGTFTYAAFYRRRVRRILPALLIMLTVTSFAAYRYLLPSELADFGRSLVAANLSVSNFYFWQHSGYFEAPALSKPLLHTWSLGIEEQFYIFLPPLLVSIKKWFPIRVMMALAGVLAASLIISSTAVHRYPSFAFYLLPSRAWELILGTIIALDEFPRIPTKFLRHLASVAGLTLILLACVLFRSTTPFPGLAALVPCLGTALVILAGREQASVVGRLLSLRPVVFVGRISYSLYLWHWPVIVFCGLGMKLVYGLDRHQSQLMMFLVSVALGTASWAIVEEPFRRGRPDAAPRRVFAVAGAGIAALSLAGGALWLSGGIPKRFSPEARRVADYMDADSGHDFYRSNQCFMLTMDWPLPKFNVDECLKHDGHKPSILILGDSHAAHLWWGLHSAYPEADVMQATSVGCKPVTRQRPRQFAGCTRLMTFMLQEYLPTHHVDVVLVEAHWDADDIPSLTDTIVWLHSLNVPVVVLGPMLQYDAPLPRLLAISMRDNDPSIPRQHRLSLLEDLDAKMAALAGSTWHVPYLSLLDILCHGGQCLQYAAPGVPLQVDYGHLTEEGSVLVAKKIRSTGVIHLQ